nr:hypothetical protein [Tanacetum cinerariifolium]
MTGNHALLTNFMEKFLRTVRFGNNDFAVIDGYVDVVIGSMTIKKVYYVEVLGHTYLALDNFVTRASREDSSETSQVQTDFASNKPLYLLHMDLYGPMRIESINGKRYVLVVVDDYSRYTWVFFLHSKDEASDVIISFFKKTQVEIGSTQQFSAARTPHQNGVVERRNRTLVEAARTILTFANLPSFL